MSLMPRWGAVSLAALAAPASPSTTIWRAGGRAMAGGGAAPANPSCGGDGDGGGGGDDDGCDVLVVADDS